MPVSSSLTKKISFTIKGNPKDPKGNPMPKVKLTGNQHWLPRAQEYQKWKEHVVFALLDSLENNLELQRICEHSIVKWDHPIALGPLEHAYMFLRIYWGNLHHGDPENVFGSIADALFFNDKNLDVETVSSLSPYREGLVEAMIVVFESEEVKLSFLENQNGRKTARKI